ncbi:MAG: hypothetical protein F4Y75_00255 [Acidimicrobiia bacterium]|nr:hypothetical protein [Acidimicrobiia bacterium]MXZ05943.1 hypothetical protein [Acidimicrobiia bacterium]MYD05024.1 hypothetical protein [Acidimicrobiia bacterium]MYF26375.1 hypothetical protein [Acidimicrobiia bacterium]MYH55335.1 hypothetical protein [Acidimicrobiia bacterium]
MSDALVGSRLPGGVRPSRSYQKGRVCQMEKCSTRISIYNRKEYCNAHAPVNFPRVRGHISPNS